MAFIIENSAGRRMIELSVDDILMIISMYQQKCNCKNYTYDEVRKSLYASQFYLPEDIR